MKYMNKSVIGIALVLSIGVAGGWWLGTRHGNQQNAPGNLAADKKILYWFDPMKPDQRFDKPGKSPFMDMDLVPRYAEEIDESTPQSLKIDPQLTQNTGLKLATVEEGVLDSRFQVTANVVFNEREVALVQARTAGIVEHVTGRAVGDLVAAGASLAVVRVPDWFVAQSEFLALRDDPELASAARSRLLQLGMSQTQIAQLAKTHTPLTEVSINSTRAGMLSEFNVRDGMLLAPGQSLAKINGLASVWVEAQVPEAQAALLHDLQKNRLISLRFAAWPNRVVQGKLVALVPELNQETRNVRVRIEVPNSSLELRPGMYATVELDAGNLARTLLIPSEAVIATGMRHVVIVAAAGGRFFPAEIALGQEQGGQSQILSGLKKGEQVVVSGQFMIDSEASLRGVLARMQANPTLPTSPTATVFEGIGLIKAIDEESITLSHEPIAALNWPAMTMPFALENRQLLTGLRVGERVRFQFTQQDDGALVHTITKDDAR